MSQMKPSLGVPCNGVQCSRGNQPCLSLWLFLSKSFFQLMTELRGTRCFNGNPAYFTFSLFSVISSLLLFFICAPSFSSVCMCVSPSSLALEQYSLHDGLLTASLPLIAVDAGSCSHSKDPAFLHKATINSAAAVSNACCFL